MAFSGPDSNSVSASLMVHYFISDLLFSPSPFVFASIPVGSSIRSYPVIFVFDLSL